MTDTNQASEQTNIRNTHATELNIAHESLPDTNQVERIDLDE